MTEQVEQDLALLARARRSLADMSDAFEILFERHKKSVLSFASFMLAGHKTTVTAEDIAQEVFIALWELPADKAPQALEGWLLGVTQHRCIDALRRRRQEPAGVELEVRDARAGPVVEAVELDYEEKLRRLVDLLPDDQKAVFWLRQAGKGFAEIAAILGCGERTAKRHMTEAREWLGKQVARLGVSGD